MNDTLRLILLPLFNTLIILLFFIFCIYQDYDLERLRLIDLNFSLPHDRQLLAAFVASVLLAFVVNITILAWPGSKQRLIIQLLREYSLDRRARVH